MASAVEPSNVIFPLASVMELAPSAVPEINVVDAKDVIPAIVPAVAPRETLLLPRDTAESVSYTHLTLPTKRIE